MFESLSPSNLKVASGPERKGGPGGLLRTPTLREERVSDKDFLLQPRVEMKSDITAAGVTQVHTETGTGRKWSEAPPTAATVTGKPGVATFLCAD